MLTKTGSTDYLHFSMKELVRTNWFGEDGPTTKYNCSSTMTSLVFTITTSI